MGSTATIPRDINDLIDIQAGREFSADAQAIKPASTGGYRSIRKHEWVQRANCTLPAEPFLSSRLRGAALSAFAGAVAFGAATAISRTIASKPAMWSAMSSSA